jgi:hypothetical protein
MNCRPALACGAILLLFSSLSYAQERREKDYELAMTLGVFQLETGEYQNAVENFKRALGLKPKDQPATMSLGVAYSRSGDYGRAREVLLKAQALDKLDARTRYELGVVLYKLGDLPGAKAQFASIDQGTADETLKDAAGEYLDIISPGTGGEKKKFSLDVLGGFQYDSNVILDPDNPVTPVGKKKSDSRFVATVNGKYRFYEAEKTAAEAGYSFYQSLHDTLHDFNVQQHGISASGNYKPSDSARYNLRYGFTYALVGNEKYSSAHRISPAAAYTFSPASVTEFFYAYEMKKFYESTLFAGNSDRNCSNNSVGVSHTVLLGKKSTVTVGYAWDRDSTTADIWSYTGNKGSVSYQGKLSNVTVSLSASYYDKKYEGALSRHDGTQEYSLSLNRDITKNVSLDLSDLYVVNDSNNMIYQYTRNIMSLMAVMRL